MCVGGVREGGGVEGSCRGGRVEIRGGFPHWFVLDSACPLGGLFTVLLSP